MLLQMVCSIDAIPAVISSIPNLQNDPFINSKYSNNSIPSLLKYLEMKVIKPTFFMEENEAQWDFMALQSSKFNTTLEWKNSLIKFISMGLGIYDEPF